MRELKTNGKNAKYITMKQAQERYQLCRNTIYDNAKKASAILKIGRAIRIDAEKIDQYMKDKYSL